jgi:hypothetical protein
MQKNLNVFNNLHKTLKTKFLIKMQGLLNGKKLKTLNYLILKIPFIKQKIFICKKNELD